MFLGTISSTSSQGVFRNCFSLTSCCYGLQSTLNSTEFIQKPVTVWYFPLLIPLRHKLKINMKFSLKLFSLQNFLPYSSVLKHFLCVVFSHFRVSDFIFKHFICLKLIYVDGERELHPSSMQKISFSKAFVFWKNFSERLIFFSK